MHIKRFYVRSVGERLLGKMVKKTLVESISNELTGLYPTFLAKSGSNTDLSRNFSAAFTTARKIHPDCSFRYFDIVH